ncbi:MAG TPA: MaoC/PaaZ C-terminal domain-containing protein [Steroidobacter sp.]|uniref:MaoC family dehydratase n=1 Tax=Steroidobacter sp. TaxID=1978227 RepID=UPI002ED97F8D
MSSPTKISFARRPSMVPAYARVLLGRKPYSAPDGTRIEPVELEARKVVLSAAHIRKYREVCAVPPSAQGLPPAYLHVLAMPLHMQLFVVKNFPVKVLGLIHLRNTIRVLAPVEEREPLRLRVFFDTMRVTDFGQEYDFTTSFEQNGSVVWEEVSTMFARGTSGPKEGNKRPVIERSNHPENGVLTDTLDVADNTGWRYARVSGDFNPIHLTARTAQMFGFKQAVAHGMWSMGRCLASASPRIPNVKIQIDTQFKLPVYIPSQALARTWEVPGGAEISMCTMKGDRLHLAMQVRTL